MNKNIIGAFVVFILVVFAAVGVKFLYPVFVKRQQEATSDAGKFQAKVTVAMDNWVGYFVLRSPEMRSLMHRAGVQWTWEDDGANYAARMERLDKGEIDFAVATVDSYILNAAPFDFPGVIVMVIDESQGGDAILAWKDKAPSIDAIKTASGLRVAFTPDSPSHHLAKSAAEHFNLPQLLPKGPARVETNGSEDAREAFIKKKADIAICWEPDVSRLLAEDGVVKILGTEDTKNLIVDILVVNRKFAQKNPELVELVLLNYFRALKKYKAEPQKLFDEVQDETGLSKKDTRSMLQGVQWVNFSENAEKWFGLALSGTTAYEGLADTIESTVRILVNSGDFSRNPIPNQDPYYLLNSRFLEAVAQQTASGFTRPGAVPAATADPLEGRFPPLAPEKWGQLKEVGTLKVEPVVFARGGDQLDVLAKGTVDTMVQRLKHYPHFRVLIKGHTGTRGDATENQRLSQARAESVKRYLEVVYNVDPNRMLAKGYGGEKPLPKQPGESSRAWRYRLPRVELVLVREDF